jgi:2-amino-4-hydroxy-6-hydroxymethyldihydropteridine diphosphokinase
VVRHRAMPEAVLALGGNLGARRAIMRAAILLLDALPGATVLARSSLYETPPLGPPQPDYLHAAVRLRWERSPSELLCEVQRIERALGRERGERWGPRTLDIDVLHWSEGELALPGLTVPHPELGTRAFALAPLLDVAPELTPAWAEALARAGGAPAHAVPSWSALQRAGEHVVGPFMSDESELAASVGDLLAAHWAHSLGVNPPRALATRWFVGPYSLFDEQAACWIEQALDDALRHGFGVRAVAITERTAAATVGAFVGEQLGKAASLPTLGPHAERRPDGQIRVRLRSGVADHGFDFG